MKECAGLLFAYLGPQPVPELPVWEPFTWENGFREIVLSDVPCNWFQCQENSCDPVHFEWMHDNWSLRLAGKTGPYASKHLQLKFEEFDHGFIYKRVREDSDERNPYWTVGRVALWPNGFYLGNHFEWRVPIDDENTLSVAWFFMRVPKGREPYLQETVPTWISPIKDENGRWISSHVINQDIIAWVGQGHDRRPHQGKYRRQRSRHRHDPQAFLRRARCRRPRRGAEGGSSAARTLAKCVELPFFQKKESIEGITLEELREVSAAQDPPEGIPALLRPAAGGAPRLRGGDGHRATVSDGFAAGGRRRARTQPQESGTAASWSGTGPVVPRFHEIAGGTCMPSAAYFRRQADICLRLSLIASDEGVSARLITWPGTTWPPATRWKGSGNLPADRSGSR